MNAHHSHDHDDLRELENELGRFDAFKMSLVPNPEHLRAALAQLPTSRRVHRFTLLPIAAPVFAGMLALVLIAMPRPSIQSTMPTDIELAAEEQAIDAVTETVDAATAMSAIDQADSDLEQLANLL